MKNSTKLSFEEAFPKITEEQFQSASKIALEINATHENDVNYSPLWEACRLFSYMLKPTYEMVNVLRLQCQLFTGNDMTESIVARYGGPIPSLIYKKYQFYTKRLPDEYICRPPRILGECGWEINGGIVNHDVLSYQRHVTNLYFHGVIQYLQAMENPVILEIGGGYGGMAYFLKKLIPRARYYMVDLPESLVFAAIYLRITMPQYVDVGDSVYNGKKPTEKGETFTFIPSLKINEIETDFDLVINTGSFGEMIQKQVEGYADFIGKNLKGILYDENQELYVPVSSILKRKFIFESAIGLSKIWAKDASVLASLQTYQKMNFSRKIVEWESRISRKVPKIQSFLRKILFR
ncbi:putative sugar O-methyltransferase [bacterium]|nr:MAG: putative sugar O-methyltransferase [bacterium]